MTMPTFNRRTPKREPLSVGGPRLTAKDFGYHRYYEPLYIPSPHAPLFDAGELRIVAQAAIGALLVATTAFVTGLLAGLIHFGYMITAGG